MKITEQEKECIIRLLLDKISEQETEINRLDKDIDQQRKLILDYDAMLVDAKNKVADLKKQLKELQGKHNKALADIKDLTARAADEPETKLIDLIINKMTNAHYNIPEHGQICLCLTTRAGCVSQPEYFHVLRYDDNKKGWLVTDGFYHYNDYIVTWWMGVDKLMEHV